MSGGVTASAGQFVEAVERQAASLRQRPAGQFVEAAASSPATAVRRRRRIRIDAGSFFSRSFFFTGARFFFLEKDVCLPRFRRREGERFRNVEQEVS